MKTPAWWNWRPVAFGPTPPDDAETIRLPSRTFVVNGVAVQAIAFQESGLLEGLECECRIRWGPGRLELVEGDVYRWG